MTTFPDLSSFLESVNGTPLTLPINGHDYTFGRDIPIKAGIRMARLREELGDFVNRLARGEEPDPSTELLDDTSETQLVLDLIGKDNLALLEERGERWPTIQRLGASLIAWHLNGPEAALLAWQGGENVPPPASSSSKPPRTSRSGSTTSKKPSSAKPKPRKSGGKTSSKRGAS